MYNRIIFLLFVILIIVFNPITYLEFFDYDGYMKISNKLIIIIIDIFLLISAVFFFINRQNTKNTLIKYLKLTFINGIGILICILILELIFGDWVHSKNNLSSYNNLLIKRNFYQTYNIDSLYENNNKFIEYKRDRFGFRGTYDNLKSIDIVTMGGSTTDQRYIDEKQTWQEIIFQKSILDENPISLVNAGVDGMSTYGHIKSIKHWLSEIDDLKPEFFLFYLGVNDVWKDTLDLYPNDKILADREKSFFEKSILWNTKIIIDNIFDERVKNINHGNNTNIMNEEWLDYGLLENYDFLNPYLNAYKERLMMIDKLVKEIGSRTIIVTNTSNLFKIKKNTIIGRDIKFQYHGKDINGVDYGHIYRLFHETSRLFCKENDVVFFNLAEDLIFDGNNDFYDSVHNTPSGTKKIGDYLFDRIKELNLSLN